jgi:hypothetical protein
MKLFKTIRHYAWRLLELATAVSAVLFYAVLSMAREAGSVVSDLKHSLSIS